MTKLDSARKDNSMRNVARVSCSEVDSAGVNSAGIDNIQTSNETRDDNRPGVPAKGVKLDIVTSKSKISILISF